MSCWIPGPYMNAWAPGRKLRLQREAAAAKAAAEATLVTEQNEAKPKRRRKTVATADAVES